MRGRVKKERRANLIEVIVSSRDCAPKSRLCPNQNNEADQDVIAFRAFKQCWLYFMILYGFQPDESLDHGSFPRTTQLH